MVIIDEGIFNDQVWEEACERYKIDDPGRNQLQEVYDEMIERGERYEQ